MAARRTAQWIDRLLSPAAANAAKSSDDARGDDWAVFRGPTRQGESNAKDLPTQWSLTENIAWKIPLPGPGASSPVVFGDRIYITSYSGYFVPGK